LKKAGEHRLTRLAVHRFDDGIADQECDSLDYAAEPSSIGAADPAHR
jgi:hypothetical protein